LDIPARGFPRGAIRVSDAERDEAVAELSKHYQVGRLTAEEFSDRSARALEARTGDQLHAPFDDLPPVTAGQAARVLSTSPLDRRPPRRLSRGRTVALVIVGYLLLSNLAGTLASAAALGWSSTIGAIVPAVVLGAFFLLLLRPLLQRRR
jgi:hypothetical protein